MLLFKLFGWAVCAGSLWKFQGKNYFDLEFLSFRWENGVYERSITLTILNFLFWIEKEKKLVEGAAVHYGK